MMLDTVAPTATGRAGATCAMQRYLTVKPCDFA
jgi:hypothetical protein